jgi:predicted RNase H-like nuclease (RuvC/YqgF family)
MNLREQKVSALLVEIEELKNVNEVIKEYNLMYLKEIAALRQQAERVHEQADLLREYRAENEDLKRRLTAQKSILSGLKKKNDHYQRALTYFAECGSERAKDVLEDFNG